MVLQHKKENLEYIEQQSNKKSWNKAEVDRMKTLFVFKNQLEQLLLQLFAIAKSIMIGFLVSGKSKYLGTTI